MCQWNPIQTIPKDTLVDLWIKYCSGGVMQAARNFVDDMIQYGQPRTGDGVRWTVTNVARAMRDL